jgi:RNA polymerase sigma-70 factor (ECF subfamily)
LLRSPTFDGKVSATLPLAVSAGSTTPEERSAAALVGTQRPSALPLEFEDVYRTFFDHVCRWTRALGGPEAERDDLVQDVFLIVHRRLPDFDGRNVAGWLYQITRHRVRDFRRLHWFRLFLSSSPADESLVSGANGPERQLDDKEQAALLSRLLSKIPEAQRAAFVLFEIDGYSGEEIARLQDVPINTVWARIHKARGKLSANVARLRRNRPQGGIRP